MEHLFPHLREQMKDLPAQEVVKGYLNRQGNRTTPNTFEGVTIGGRRSPVK